MKIAIDCFKLIKGNGKSVGIYNLSLNLIKNLAKNNIFNYEIYIIGTKYNKNEFDVDGTTFIEISELNPFNKIDCIYWELYKVTSVVKKHNIGKVVFPRGFSSLSRSLCDYIIIHDMIPFYYNEMYSNYFNRIENFYIMSRLKSSAKKCKKIITISEESKKDIIKYCKVDENKIVVINNGLNEIKDCNSLKKENYISTITSNFPHKNKEAIINSYRHYLDTNVNPLDLLVIGLDEKDVAIDENLRNKITFIKYIENNDELYKKIESSQMFLFLSLKEGFGFPPIEAMQLGVPVICSNVSSLPEVVGDSALLVDPYDYKEVAESISMLQNSESKRRELIKKGYKNIKRFDWNIIAKKYWSVFNNKNL